MIVSLLAQVARNYVALRGTQYRLAVARRNAENQRQTLDLTVALLEGGRGTELDTSRAEAQWQSTLASIPPLETAIKAAMYRLHDAAGQRRLELEGSLAGVWVSACERCWRTAKASPPNRTLAVDLTSVTFIDQAGRYLLPLMPRDGVRFVASDLILQDILDHVTGMLE